MDPLPAFPLFPDPIREGVIEPSLDRCDICQRARGYLYADAPFSASPATDNLTVCPWCIADGSAAARGLTFNDPTIYPCFDSTPQMTPEDRDQVQCRTPGFTTWQGNHWLMCCGRACIYLGEADATDLHGRWRTAIRSMFEDDGWHVGEMAEIVCDVARGRGPCAYVFQCRTCERLRGYWDCH